MSPSPFLAERAPFRFGVLAGCGGRAMGTSKRPDLPMTATGPSPSTTSGAETQNEPGDSCQRGGPSGGVSSSSTQISSVLRVER